MADPPNTCKHTTLQHASTCSLQMGITNLEQWRKGHAIATDITGQSALFHICKSGQTWSPMHATCHCNHIQKTRRWWVRVDEMRTRRCEVSEMMETRWKERKRLRDANWWWWWWWVGTHGGRLLQQSITWRHSPFFPTSASCSLTSLTPPSYPYRPSPTLSPAQIDRFVHNYCHFKSQVDFKDK